MFTDVHVLIIYRNLKRKFKNRPQSYPNISVMLAELMNWNDNKIEEPKDRRMLRKKNKEIIQKSSEVQVIKYFQFNLYYFYFMSKPKICASKELL